MPRTHVPKEELRELEERMDRRAGLREQMLESGTVLLDLKREDIPKDPVLRSSVIPEPVRVRVSLSKFPAIVGGVHYHIGLVSDQDHFWLAKHERWPDGVWARTWGFPEQAVALRAIVETEEQAQGWLRLHIERLKPNGYVFQWEGARGAISNPPPFYPAKVPRLVQVWGMADNMGDELTVVAGDHVRVEDNGRGYPCADKDSVGYVGRCREVINLHLRPDEDDKGYFYAILED